MKIFSITFFVILLIVSTPYHQKNISKVLKRKRVLNETDERFLKENKDDSDSEEKMVQALTEIKSKRTFDENDSDEDHYKGIAGLLKNSKKESKNPLNISNKSKRKNTTTTNLRTKNQSYIEFKRQHELDMDMAKISIASYEKKTRSNLAVIDEIEKTNEESENANRCNSDFKMSFFKEIDFGSDDFKLTDSSIEKFCPYLRQTCCSGEEINKRFEIMSMKFDKILIDLHEIYSFFKYMSSLTTEDIHQFTKKNYNKINKCLLNDPVELDTILLEFKTNGKMFTDHYFAYIKKRFKDIYSLQCGVCDFKNSNFFSANILNNKYNITINYEELFDFIESIFFNDKVFDIFSFASFLECFAFDNKTPVNFMPDPALYKMHPYWTKKSFVLSISKKTKLSKQDQTNLVVPDSIVTYMNKNHPVLGFEIVEWGKLLQTVQRLMEGKKPKTKSYNTIKKHIQAFKTVNDQLPHLNAENVEIIINSKGYTRLENKINTKNKYLRNDMGDLKVILFYSSVGLWGAKLITAALALFIR